MQRRLGNILAGLLLLASTRTATLAQGGGGGGGRGGGGGAAGAGAAGNGGTGAGTPGSGAAVTGGTGSRAGAAASGAAGQNAATPNNTSRLGRNRTGEDDTIGGRTGPPRSPMINSTTTGTPNIATNPSWGPKSRGRPGRRLRSAPPRTRLLVHGDMGAALAGAQADLKHAPQFLASAARDETRDD